jgi:small subunit ribosomal protein S13
MDENEPEKQPEKQVVDDAPTEDAPEVTKKEEAPSEPKQEVEEAAETPADDVQPEPEEEAEKEQATKATETAEEKAEVKPEKPKAPAEKPKAPKKDKEPTKTKVVKEDEEIDEDFKYIVRIANTDLNGHKRVVWGLTGITGIGFRLATIIADSAKIPRTKKLGKLTDEEVELLEEQVKDLTNKVPAWLMNRQKDNISGEDTHIYGADIGLILRDDINRLKMIRCYRGIRHEQGQKVRGQRTRANGRKGATVGVMKKAVRQKQSGGKK